MGGPRRDIVIWFMVPGEPVSKERPRTVSGHTYTPQKTLDHEQKIRDVWNLTVRKWDPKGKFHVELGFDLERNNKDIDNLIKTVLDALHGLAWRNDLQVQSVMARKCKHKPGGTSIRIARIEE